MPNYAMTGQDTLTLFDRVFGDFADGTNVSVEFANDVTGQKTGKNGNTIYAINETGKNANIVIRLLRSSTDDEFLNAKYNEYLRDPASFVLGNGSFVKRLGDGQGNIKSDNYTFQGVTFTNGVNGQENVEGDTEQGVAVYNLRVAVATRSIG